MVVELDGLDSGRMCLPERVWYAAYGSNLLSSRLRCYLRGGAATSRHAMNPGARDASDPRRNVMAKVTGEVAFGKWSESWGGGVAFFDADVGEEAIVRLWDVSREQFEDICAQENGLNPGAVCLGWEKIWGHGECLIEGSRWYPLVRVLGEFDGMMVVTVTGEGGVWVAPGEAYLDVILSGLSEGGVGSEVIAAYKRQILRI